MQQKEALPTYGEMEIAERNWLIVGLMWMALGVMSLGPFGVVARAGRILFALALVAHILGALYAAIRARSAGLSARTWLLRTLVLGSFAVLALKMQLESTSRVRRIR